MLFGAMGNRIVFTIADAGLPQACAAAYDLMLGTPLENFGIAYTEGMAMYLAVVCSEPIAPAT